MATINGKTNSSYYIIWLDAYETSYNIVNNTSNVTVKLYMKRTKGSYPDNGGTYNGKITLNGIQKNYSGTLPYPTSFSEGQSRLYATVNFTDIPHESDGTKTVSVSATYSAGFSPTSGSASGSFALTNIPRGSTITATSAYIEEVSQLTIFKNISSYTHTIRYSFGDFTGYILANGTTSQTPTKLSETSIGFPIPSSWYSVLPNSPSGLCTLLIDTFDGDTQIGDTNYTQFRVNVNPQTNSPVIEATITDTNTDATSLTGSNVVLIKNFSLPQIDWGVTLKHGASLSSITINNNTPTVSPYVTLLTDNTITITAVDTRGFSDVYVAQNIIKDYDVPSYTLDGERPAPTSLDASVRFSGTWWNDNFGASNNALEIIWQYKKTTDSNWTTGGTLTEGTDYTISGNGFWSGISSSPTDIQIGGNLDYAFSWDLAIVVTDKVTSISRTITITKGIPVVNWDDDAWYFNVDAVSEIYAPYNFTSSDVDKISDYINGTGTLTPDELILYDVNKDDVVNATDLNIIENYIKYHVTTSNPIRAKIYNGKYATDTKITLEDGNGTELTKVGLDNIRGYDPIAQASYELSPTQLSLEDSNNNTINFNTGWLPKQVLASWFSTTAETITDGMSHAMFIIVGRASSGAYRNSLVIPTASIPTSNTLYQLTDDVNYFSFYLRYSGNDIIITGHQRSSGGYIETAWLMF